MVERTPRETSAGKIGRIPEENPLGTFGVFCN